MLGDRQPGSDQPASQILRACRGAAAEPVQAALPARTGMLRGALKLVTSRKKQRG
jgi:hypothetical protein